MYAEHYEDKMIYNLILILHFFYKHYLLENDE